MTLPTIASLTELAHGDRALALKIRHVIRYGLPPDEDLPASVQSWLRACYHRPRNHEIKMATFDAWLNLYGVEAIFRRPNDAWPAYEYLNTGDLYDATLVRSQSGRYRVTDIGSILESRGYEEAR
jgi:hypothetical protein